MTLLTLFSAPKPFTNPHIAMIQRNAIKSWTLLPDVEVVLIGKEEGLAEAAQELGVKHVPHVASNRNGHAVHYRPCLKLHVAQSTQQQRTALHHQRGHDPDARFCRSGETSCEVER